MGYESTLIIGTRFGASLPDDPGQGVNTIATLDLSKAGTGAFARLVAREKALVENGDAPRYWVFDGPVGESEAVGNEVTARDCYDDPLVALPLDEVISAIEHDNRTEKYRRFDAALALLKSFNTDSWRGYDEPVVLHYGH